MDKYLSLIKARTTADDIISIFSILVVLGSFVCLLTGRELAAIFFVLFAIWLVM